ncbi:hypothetical protein FACS189427_06160 [Planctomycetales bacterium]|nr:hypothetical protein FACS189427_06160 [Planctomycetales bacterium]
MQCDSSGTIVFTEESVRTGGRLRSEKRDGIARRLQSRKVSIFHRPEIAKMGCLAKSDKIICHYLHIENDFAIGVDGIAALLHEKFFEH